MTAKAVAARRLEALAGRWAVEADVPARPGRTVRGSATFEWLGGRELLVMRSKAPKPFPSTLAVIAPDRGRYVMHYFDSRGVARVYRMSLARGVWKLWRDGPDFAQRFTGRLRERGRRIDGAWEIKTGRRWEHDFRVTYRKARAT